MACKVSPIKEGNSQHIKLFLACLFFFSSKGIMRPRASWIKNDAFHHSLILFTINYEWICWRLTKCGKPQSMKWVEASKQGPLQEARVIRRSFTAYRTWTPGFLTPQTFHPGFLTPVDVWPRYIWHQDVSHQWIFDTVDVWHRDNLGCLKISSDKMKYLHIISDT